MQSKNVLSSAHAKRPYQWAISQVRTDSYELYKRIFDIIITLPMFVITLPLLLICMVMIKIDSPGPIFLIQERTGKGGKRFKMYKLRTMVANAEELKEKFQHLNQLSYPDFKIDNDPRITRTGKFFRKTSLDELPQLINVLKGNMSLVGPRPTSFSASTYDLWHTGRLQVTPGITGLWQISGRSDINFDDRARLDIEYIRNRSLQKDLVILFKTIHTVISKNGAY